MSKVRVHELAKEIDKTSKDIMEYLNGNGADLKSHMSFLTDQQVEAVKKKFGKAAPAGDAPKKKTIVQVFRPQNTQGGQRRQGGRGGQRQTQAGADSRPGANRDRKEGSVSAQERGRDNNRPAKDRDGNRPARDFRDRVAMAETKEMEEIATARIKSARDVISATVTEETKIVRTGVKEMVRTKTARAETSVIATVRAEIIETEGIAMAETETVRDASVTARAEEEETEEITDHPFRPRLWQNRSRKGDPRRIIIRKKSMTVRRSGKANLVKSKARERKISSL